MDVLTEFSVQLTGIFTAVLIWAARMLFVRINKLSRPKKWLVNLGLSFILTKVGTALGVDIDGLESLFKPELAESVTSALMAAGMWDLSKRILRWRKRYNIDAIGRMVHTKPGQIDNRGGVSNLP